MPIPVPTPGPVQPGAINVAGSLGAATADAQALASLGASVVGLSEKLESFSLRRADLKNRADIIETASRWAEEESQLQQDLLTQPEFQDESTWIPEADRRLGALRQDWEAAQIAPEARDAISERWLEFSSRTKIRIGGQAMARGIERAKQRSELAIQRFIDAGDLDGALGVVDTLLPGTTPEERELAKHGIRQQFTEEEIQKRITMDPVGIEKELESGAYAGQVPARKLRYLQEDARIAANRTRSETFSELTLEFMDGKFRSPDDIDSMAEQGLISKGQALAYRREYDSKVPSEDDVRLFNDLHKEALRYNPAGDRDQSKFADLAGRIAFSGLPSARLTDLKKALDERTKGFADSDKMKATMLRDTLQRGFEDGQWFGAIPKVEVDGEMVPDPVRMQEAHQAYDDMRLELEQWIKSGDYDDLLKDGREWMYDRMRETIPATGAEEILRSLPDTSMVADPDEVYTSADNFPSQYFSVNELASKGDGSVKADGELLNAANAMREKFGGPVAVTSGYRDPAYNEKKGGAKRSQHMEGKALDVSMAGMDTEDKKRLLRSALESGFRGIGFYAKSPNMLHVDVGEKRTWHWGLSNVPAWAKDIMEEYGYDV